MQQSLIADSAVLPVRPSEPICVVRSYIAVIFFSHGTVLHFLGVLYFSSMQKQANANLVPFASSIIQKILRHHL
jgi:hypothetical protein